MQESSIDILSQSKNLEKIIQINKNMTFNTQNYIKKYSKQKKNNEKFALNSENINNNFYVMTINSVKSK